MTGPAPTIEDLFLVEDKRKSVLVTGGAGFIGVRLVNALVQEGHTVAVIDRLEQMRRRMHQDVRFFTANIIFEDVVKRRFEQFLPDVVIHLAAHTRLNHSMIAPFIDESSNIQGTLSVLDACREAAVKRVIYTSSCAVYGDGGDIPVRELHRLRPQSSYGVSKLAAEYYVRLYSDVWGIKHKIFRLGNVYGPHSHDGVITNFIDSVNVDRAPTINGDGTQTRDYIYLDDVVSALIAAVGATGDDDTYNLGTGTPTSVNDVFKVVSDAFESEVEPHFAPPRIGDIDHICLDSTKYKAVFQPEPFTTLQDGIAKMKQERRTA